MEIHHHSFDQFEEFYSSPSQQPHAQQPPHPQHLTSNTNSNGHLLDPNTGLFAGSGGPCPQQNEQMIYIAQDSPYPSSAAQLAYPHNSTPTPEYMSYEHQHHQHQHHMYVDTVQQPPETPYNDYDMDNKSFLQQQLNSSSNNNSLIVNYHLEQQSHHPSQQQLASSGLNSSGNSSVASASSSSQFQLSGTSG